MAFKNGGEIMNHVLNGGKVKLKSWKDGGYISFEPDKLGVKVAFFTTALGEKVEQSRNMSKEYVSSFHARPMAWEGCL